MANVITIFRLLAVALIIFLGIRDELSAVFIIFVLASVSDLLDGYVARNFGRVTVLGAMLDPLADRLLLISILVLVWAKGLAWSWLCVLLIAREALSIAGYQLVRSLGYDAMSVSMMGKISSAMSMISLAVLLVIPAFGNILLGLAVTLSYISLGGYVKTGFSLIGKDRPVNHA